MSGNQVKCSVRLEQTITRLFGSSTIDFYIENWIGLWSFERKADNGTQVTGDACLEKGLGCICYSEEGTVQVPTGEQFHSSQCYYFQQEGNLLNIFFDKPLSSRFHSLPLEQEGLSIIGQGNHICGDDEYISVYRFGPNGTFQISHDVSGPRKAYFLRTVYCRKRVQSC